MGQERVVIGRIGAPFGLKGWVHLHSFLNPPENILKYKTWFLKEDTIKIKEIRIHGKSFAALMEGCQSREDAQLLTNQEIQVPKASLPPLKSDTYYWSELIGLNVITNDGEHLGKVDFLFETGANDVLVVKGEDRERLLPYVPKEVIQKIDLKAGEMQVLWDPEF